MRPHSNIPPNGRTVQVTAGYYATNPGLGGPDTEGTRIAAWYIDRFDRLAREVFVKNVVCEAFLLPIPFYGLRLARAVHRAEKVAGKVALEKDAALIPMNEAIQEWPSEAELKMRAAISEAMAIEDPWAGPTPPLYRSSRPN